MRVQTPGLEEHVLKRAFVWRESEARAVFLLYSIYLTLLCHPSLVLSRRWATVQSFLLHFTNLTFPSGGASRKDSQQRAARLRAHAAARLLTCKVCIQNPPASSPTLWLGNIVGL